MIITDERETECVETMETASSVSSSFAHFTLKTDHGYCILIASDWQRCSGHRYGEEASSSVSVSILRAEKYTCKSKTERLITNSLPTTGTGMATNKAQLANALWGLTARLEPIFNKSDFLAEPTHGINKSSHFRPTVRIRKQNNSTRSALEGL